MNRTFLVKLTVVQQVKFDVFNGNGRFVTMFTRAHHWPRPDSNESSSYSYTLKLILIVSHLCLRFLLSLGFPLVSPFIHLYELPIVCIYATSTAHLILFDLIIVITFREA